MIIDNFSLKKGQWLIISPYVNFSRLLTIRNKDFRLLTRIVYNFKNGQDYKAWDQMKSKIRLYSPVFIHSKLYIQLSGTNKARLIIGSSNFTNGGFESNQEVNFALNTGADDSRVQTIIRIFNKYWKGASGNVELCDRNPHDPKYSRPQKEAIAEFQREMGWVSQSDEGEQTVFLKDKYGYRVKNPLKQNIKVFRSAIREYSKDQILGALRKTWKYQTKYRDIIQEQINWVKSNL